MPQKNNSMSPQILKLKYFEEGTWSEKRPAACSDFHLKNISICNIDFKKLDVGDVDRFIALFCEKAPSIVVVQNISTGPLDKLKSNSLIRKMYALCETTRSEKGECMTIFFRHGLQCEPSEINIGEKDNVALKALLVQLPVHVAGKQLININVVNADYSVTKSKKVIQLTDALLNQIHDGTIVLSNDCEELSFTSDVYKDLKQNREKNGFVDLVSEGLEKLVPSAWVMWMKTTKFVTVKDSSFAESIRGQEIQFIMTSVTLRAGGGSIAIPMPRSQKATQPASKSPGNLSNNSALSIDPAILSAESSRAGKGGGDTRPSRPRWKISYTIPLKNNEVSMVDHCLDLSQLFPSVEIAVEELNKNLNWPLDFVVVHHYVLYSDGVAISDRQSFIKKVCREIKPTTRQEIELAIQNYKIIYNQEKLNWAKKTPDTANAFTRAEPTHREWSESCCTIVYQITPRDKLFDISQKMGLDKDNLKKAIKYLNRVNTSKDDNPLYDYAYDYALFIFC